MSNKETIPPALILMKTGECKDRYDPFPDMRNDWDVEVEACNVIERTAPPAQKGRDPFWEKYEQALLAAIFAYIFHYVEEGSRNLTNAILLIQSGDQDTGKDGSVLDRIFAEIPQDSHAAAQYRIYQLSSTETQRTIRISCISRIRKYLEKDGLKRIERETNNE